MTEQKIEQKIITALQTALTGASVTGVEIIGAWQSASTGEVKGKESAAARGYLTVKVSPRQHETFTIPEASFDVQVQLNVRTEVDEDGVGYLAITNACAAALYAWQKKFSDYSTAFAIPNEFTPTGFRLDGGDCGLDKQNALWSWIQNFTVQGIIKN